jgi:peptidoglycan/xylan/chitin deacetylase (PgdA/CDA1 family)
MKLGLKVDVDTLRGTQIGVPNLLKMLDRHRLQATFLFSLGPDQTGRAVRRVFRRGFFGKVARTSVLSHYGLRTLLYGTLLPGPDIGLRSAGLMRSVREAGHEVGIHTWNHVQWQDQVERADAAWTEREMLAACQRFEATFGAKPRTYGAAGWQMNLKAFRFEEEFGFDYCSDTRGVSAFLPVVDGQLIRCAQLPTTLPTLDELLGRDGLSENNVAQTLLDQTQRERKDHVYTLHAELEGMKLAPVFDRLLAGWARQGYSLGSVRAIFDSLNANELPPYEVARGEVAGRSGTLMLQGKAVPARR